MEARHPDGHNHLVPAVSRTALLLVVLCQCPLLAQTTMLSFPGSNHLGPAVRVPFFHSRKLAPFGVLSRAWRNATRVVFPSSR